MENLLHQGVLGLNVFNHPWIYQMSYVIHPVYILLEHITGKFRLKIPVTPYWMEAVWLPRVLSILKTFLIGVPL